MHPTANRRGLAAEEQKSTAHCFYGVQGVNFVGAALPFSVRIRLAHWNYYHTAMALSTM